MMHVVHPPRPGDSFHGVGAALTLKAFGHCLNRDTSSRMDQIGGQLGQRFQHEAAFMQSGMGQSEHRRLDDQIADKEQVDVNDTGLPTITTRPSERSFDGKCNGQQVRRRKRCMDAEDGVQVRRLVRRPADRAGLIEGRDITWNVDVQNGMPTKCMNGGAKRKESITEIGADAQEGKPHAAGQAFSHNVASALPVNRNMVQSFSGEAPRPL